ncbi:hypothetical protein [uncultured Jatrophihabitans sp.]|uniref:hypothetical protein n=1 Tax=uncultured Jatrophihabitans sp. TaxID=1610747 RepID=UPI0035CB12C0
MTIISTRFPAPPGSVTRVLDMLAILRRGDPGEIEEAGIAYDVPRPWIPATCPADLREDVWGWCDDVAAWINHEYAWRPAQMIPPCWPHHAHIARELAVLAFLRWTAEASTGPEAVEDWHRYTFPMFCDRMTGRLGESKCRTGEHVQWPAESRYHSYIAAMANDDRQRAFHADTHRPNAPTPILAGRRG